MLLAVQECDADGWQQFVTLYQPLVYGYARQRGLNPEDAADTSQQVFCKILQNIGGFRRQPHKGGLRNWMRRITHNEIVSLHRRRATKPTEWNGMDGSQHWQAPAETEANDAEVVEREREDLEFLRRVLQRIKPSFKETTWQAFWRTAVDGLSAAEAGAEIGMNAKAVREAKRRVRDRLRKEMIDA